MQVFRDKLKYIFDNYLSLCWLENALLISDGPLTIKLKITEEENLIVEYSPCTNKS